MLGRKVEIGRKTDGTLRKTALTGLLAAAAAFITAGCNQATESAPAPEQRAPAALAARGSSAKPTDISTLDQLRGMGLTGNYRLTKDITMKSTDAGFVPIGSPFAPFRGTFDGNGFSIINFRTANNSNPGWYRGLFSGTDNAILRKIRLINVNVVGEAYTGAIAGTMSNTLLENSYVTGNVSGLFYPDNPGYAIGMAVGHAGDYSEIRRCQASGSVKGIVLSAGGFIGQASGWGEVTLYTDPRVKIEEIYTDVNVDLTPPGPSYDGVNVAAGGLAGIIQGALVKNIYAVGNVKGRGWPGGLVGRVINGDPGYATCELNQSVYIGDVASTSGGPRAGAIGSMDEYFHGTRCAVYYNKSVDGGVALPTSDIACNAGKTTQELQNAHPAPNQVWEPYITGQLITQQMINQGDFPQCRLNTGSENEWGFGTCGTPVVWKANAYNQYNTLTNIPEPTLQRLQ